MESFNPSTGDIIITLPKNIKWSEYDRELAKAEVGAIMNFKVPSFPSKTKKGNRCYLCYQGNIIGYMIICGFSEKNFLCSTTGNYFEGKFVERTGKFFHITPVPCKGFQGYRYALN